MEALIARTAMSPFIREKKDFFTAFLNPKGELVVSTSLTLAGNLVDAILETYPAETMRPGDLYWYNDAYGTGGAVSHLPDMVFVRPVFHEDRLIAFSEAWGHLWDIGGSVPGSISPHATSVFQEGIMIPPVRVMRDGVENDRGRPHLHPQLALSGDAGGRPEGDHGRLPPRRAPPDRNRHALWRGCGGAGFRDHDRTVRARAARPDRETRIPDGAYSFRDRIDSDAVTDRSYFVDVTLRKRARRSRSISRPPTGRRTGRSTS